MTVLVALFLQLALDGRPYHRVVVRDIPTTTWTHVCTTGLVTGVRKERDGDIHIRLTDDGVSFVIGEILPGANLPRPRTGQTIVACGITRYDKRHRWYELHPLETWAEVRKP